MYVLCCVYACDDCVCMYCVVFTREMTVCICIVLCLRVR